MRTIVSTISAVFVLSMAATDVQAQQDLTIESVEIHTRPVVGRAGPQHQSLMARIVGILSHNISSVSSG